MNGHLHTTRKAQDRADLHATAMWWWIIVGIGALIALALFGACISPLLWAVAEVCFATRPNPAAPTVITLYLLGAIVAAVLIARARLKRPARTKTTTTLPNSARDADGTHPVYYGHNKETR